MSMMAPFGTLPVQLTIPEGSKQAYCATVLLPGPATYWALVSGLVIVMNGGPWLVTLLAEPCATVVAGWPEAAWTGSAMAVVTRAAAMATSRRSLMRNPPPEIGRRRPPDAGPL